MSDQVLKPTFTITIGEGEHAEEFVLRVPTPMERARLGVREAAVRRMLDPVAVDATQLDPDTWCLVRGMVVLEQLLEKANVKWPYSEVQNAKGEPELMVVINNFPSGKEPVLMEVGAQFQDALDRFHSDRVKHSRSSVSEDVAGRHHTGAL